MQVSCRRVRSTTHSGVGGQTGSVRIWSTRYPPATLSARSATGCVVLGLGSLPTTSPTRDDETRRIDGSVHEFHSGPSSCCHRSDHSEHHSNTVGQLLQYNIGVGLLKQIMFQSALKARQRTHGWESQRLFSGCWIAQEFALVPKMKSWGLWYQFSILAGKTTLWTNCANYGAHCREVRNQLKTGKSNIFKPVIFTTT